MSLGQVMIFSSSLETAREFYTKHIGLEVLNDMSKELGMLIMKNDNCYLTIHEKFKPRQVDIKDCQVIPIFIVENIEKSRKSLLDNGIEVEGNIKETPVHRFQMLKDPDGNWIEVAEFKHYVPSREDDSI